MTSRLTTDDRLRGPPWPSARPSPSSLVQQVFFPAPAGIVVRGVIVGGLTALLALGMALVYRANRIINFAQADLGFAPAVLAYLLLDEVGRALGGGGGRRPRRRPAPRRRHRAGGHPPLLPGAPPPRHHRHHRPQPGAGRRSPSSCPQLWDRRLVSDRIAPPFDPTFSIGSVTFDANDLLALVVTPVVVAVVAPCCGAATPASPSGPAPTTPTGPRCSASPSSASRRSCGRGAAALAFVTVFLRGGILGLPTGTELGLSVLLRALVALLLGRLTNLTARHHRARWPSASSSWASRGTTRSQLVDPILGAGRARRPLARSAARPTAGDDDDEATAWQAAEEIRPVPAGAGRPAVVRRGRWALAAAAVAVAAVLPFVLERRPTR